MGDSSTSSTLSSFSSSSLFTLLGPQISSQLWNSWALYFICIILFWACCSAELTECIILWIRIISCCIHVISDLLDQLLTSLSVAGSTKITDGVLPTIPTLPVLSKDAWCCDEATEVSKAPKPVCIKYLWHCLMLIPFLSLCTPPVEDQGPIVSAYIYYYYSHPWSLTRGHSLMPVEEGAVLHNYAK
jgi:hypothetical protein